MKRTSLSIAGALTSVLVLVSAPAAQAALKPSDAANQADIIKVFPQLADGAFATEKSNKISVPGQTCGVPEFIKGKSISTGGSSSQSQLSVVAGVSEFKSKAEAKRYLASYKKYAKRCASFGGESEVDAVTTMSLVKAPKLGEGAIAVDQQTAIMGNRTYGTILVIVQGKRVATVLAFDAAPVSKSAITKLAKVAVKKAK